MGGLDGLNPEFAARLQALAAAAQAAGTQIGWGSGNRSIEDQIALRQSNGCPDIWTAPASSCRVPTAIPGRSNHNHGLAMDITGDKAWANANAAQFGLHFPVDGEDWHIEMIDDDGSREHMQGAQGQGAIGFDLEWQSPARTPEDELSYRLDTVMSMLSGSAPTAETPADMISPAELSQDVTTMAGGEPSTRTTPVASSGGAGGDLKGMVRQMAAQMGWGEDQWPALEELVQRESSWNPTAQNPTSTAFGLFQFLDSTWANYGQKTSDPAAQAQAGLSYIRDRYGSPSAALSFHDRKNYY